MKIWILLLAILIVNIALAEDNAVYLLDLHYDNGDITLNEIKIETGFSPDRKIQSGDYKLEVISPDNRAIYSFSFKSPRVYADKSDKLTGEINGEVTDLKEADFTLIVPYFREGKDIRIRKEHIEIFSTDISQFTIQQSPKRSFTWTYIILLFLSLFFFIFLLTKRKKVNQ